ncbi:MAG: hypothetical protein KUG72_00520, partial [Pseudomonadales bacterium]|nr:hypothetical protein [Pseudomonadales bacterium]
YVYSLITCFFIEVMLSPLIRWPDLLCHYKGTYDSYLEFIGTSNHVMLHFKVGDTYCGTETVDYILEGVFEISQENLLCIQKGFEELVTHA